jgi:archaellum biogenesis protein FlaJ (TadC family)
MSIIHTIEELYPPLNEKKNQDRVMKKLCMPALIYLVYSFTHVVIDTYKGLYNTAIMELWIGVVFTLLLNVLCDQNLGIVAWLIISIPFLLMTVIASLLLFMFRLNPATGQAIQTNTQTSQTQTSQTQTPIRQAIQQTIQPKTNQNQTTQTTPSNYALPVSVYYGSLGNSKQPATTR